MFLYVDDQNQWLGTIFEETHLDEGREEGKKIKIDHNLQAISRRALHMGLQLLIDINYKPQCGLGKFEDGMTKPLLLPS